MTFRVDRQGTQYEPEYYQTEAAAEARANELVRNGATHVCVWEQTDLEEKSA